MLISCDNLNQTSHAPKAERLLRGLRRSCRIPARGDFQNATMNTTIKHGHNRRGKKSKTYQCWRDMIDRCRYPAAHGYNRYGGRGIKVCNRWLKSFLNFLSDMGEKPDGMTIERKDFDGHYTPKNCCWIPKKDQQKNTCRTIFLTHNGKTQCRRDWERELGLSRGTIRHRMLCGWTLEKSLTKIK